MTTRAQAAENALASVRAEGLDPGVAEALLCRWARGELTPSKSGVAQSPYAGHGCPIKPVRAPIRSLRTCSIGVERMARHAWYCSGW
jgi:hypothetical protein